MGISLGSLGPLLRRTTAGLLALATVWSPTGARAAVRRGGTGANGDFDMLYVDVDSDPNTYNSSRAEVRRVLIAEPGGQYKELLADTVTGHQVARGTDAFQASADVTELVRDSGSGLYTVARINVAMGQSEAEAWGGWTLVVAYENAGEPLRHLALWDGFDAVRGGEGLEVRLPGTDIPAGAAGRAGLVAYDGDRDRTGDSLTFSTGTRAGTALTDSVNPAHGVLNSTISEPGEAPAARVPAYANTLGHDSDVFDLGLGLTRGGDQPAFRLVSQRDAAWAGALFVAVDARQ